MIYEARVYDAFCTDFDNEGLVGALMPTSITHDGIAGNLGTLEMVHPLDPAGKWTQLVRGNIIKAWTRVRTVADMDGGEIVTSVEKWTVKDTSSKAERAVYNKKAEGKKTGSVKKGQKVLVTQKPADAERVKIKAENITGWIDPAALEYEATEILPSDPTAIEDIYPMWGMKEQLFRIYDEDRTLNAITVYARPIFGDLLGNMTVFKNIEAVSLQHAAARMLERCVYAHDFSVMTNIADTRTGVNWRLKNPIYAFFDPEEGICARWNCQAVIDNYEITLMKQAGKNRGMAVEYGRNLTGVSCNIVDEEVITTVLPTGLTEDGKILYLTDDTDELNPGNWITAGNAGDYPNPHVYHLECEDCTVAEDLSKEKARQRMREQAQELLDSGVTLPTVNIKVTFADLGSTEEYSAWREVMHMDLYDKVRVRVPKIGFDGLLDVVRVKTDCKTGRVIETEIGALADVEVTIANYQVSGIAGGKIFAGTILTPQLGTNIIHAEHITANSIAARHITADSIYTDALQARSVTAEKIAAKAINADLIEAGTIIADLIAAGAIEAYHIKAGAVDAEKIAAGTITAKQLKAGLITADSGLIAVGAIQTAQIADGSITAAKVVDLNADVIKAGTLSADRLLIKGSDGLFYKINAEASGLSLSQLTQDQYKNYINGTVIVAKSITAAQIAAKAITANEIAANTITAAQIDVADLFASEATIAQINAMDIRGNQYLQLMVGEAAGGINYLKNSARGASGTSYPLIIYELADSFENGEMVTFTVWDATLGSGKSSFTLYDGSGIYPLGNLADMGGGKYSATFAYKAQGSTSAIALYAMPGSVSVVSTVGKAKLERGTKSTAWTPSPLDPPDELIAGSTVLITEDETKFETPKFRVRTNGAEFDIPGDGEDGRPTVQINKDGMVVDTLTASGEILAPNVHERTEGGKSYAVGAGGDYASLSAAFSELNGRYLENDVILKLVGETDAGGSLRGISGPGRVIIAPINLMNTYNGAAWVNTSATVYSMGQTGGVYMKAQSAGPSRYATLNLGYVGPLGLRGKTITVSCQMYSGSAEDPAYPSIAFICGDANWVWLTRPEDAAPTDWVTVKTTFTVPERMGYWDEFKMYFYMSVSQSVTTTATAYFRSPKMEFGSDITSLNTGMNICSVNGINAEGCTAQICMHSLVFPSSIAKGIEGRGSFLNANRCTFNGAVGMQVWGGCGSMYNCYGACSVYAARTGGGGVIEVFGSAPSGTQSGLIDNGQASGNNPGGDTPVVSKTETFKAAKSGTYSGSAWWTSDAALRQGRTTANGELRGGVWFEHSISSTSITKMELRLRRAEGYGKSSAVTVKIYGTNSAALSGKPAASGTPVTGTIGPGKTKTFDITSLKAYKGFVLLADDGSVISGKTYSNNFARFTGTGGGADTIPLLTITHT